MRALHEVVVTRVGLCTPLGAEPAAILEALGFGAVATRAQAGLAALPSDRAAVVAGPDLRPWLKRRKDAKLLARPAELALAAAAGALEGYGPERAELGVFLGVGREPPDQGESEACLAAAAREGRLDEERLAGAGRDLYPPLLPLKTLPNMALAHISINLGPMGENGAWAGGVGASWAALASAWWAVAEGRCPAALAGGADSLVDLGSARDRLRLGASGPPGEAAALLLLESRAQARERGVTPLATLRPLSPEAAALARDVGVDPLRAAMGELGAAEGALLLALALHDPEGPRALAGGEPGLAPSGFEILG